MGERRSDRGRRGRGFTLSELVVILVVLAISVPATLGLFQDVTLARRESVQARRAVLLAESMIETVLSDAYQPDAGLGMVAVSAPGYGDSLGDRMGGVLEFYEQLGYVASVSVSEPIAAHGAATGGAEDVFRRVTVSVTWTPAGKSAERTYDVAILVAPLSAASWGGSPTGGAGYGSLATSGTITLADAAVLDSYDSSEGAYGGSNVGLSALVATNSTTSSAVVVKDDAELRGSVYVGVGGSASSGISVEDEGVVVGSQGVLEEAIAMPGVSPPAGMPGSMGEGKFESGTTVISGDVHFDSFKIESGATVRISGDVRMLVDDEVKLETGGQIELDVGATLELYFYGQLKVENSSSALNADSSRAGDVLLHSMGGSELKIEGGVVCATIEAPLARLVIESTGVVAGTFRGRELAMSENAEFHQDVGSE